MIYLVFTNRPAGEAWVTAMVEADLFHATDNPGGMTYGQIGGAHADFVGEWRDPKKADAEVAALLARYREIGDALAAAEAERAVRR